MGPDGLDLEIASAWAADLAAAVSERVHKDPECKIANWTVLQACRMVRACQGVSVDGSWGAQAACPARRNAAVVPLPPSCRCRPPLIFYLTSCGSSLSLPQAEDAVHMFFQHNIECPVSPY